HARPAAGAGPPGKGARPGCTLLLPRPGRGRARLRPGPLAPPGPARPRPGHAPPPGRPARPRGLRRARAGAAGACRAARPLPARRPAGAGVHRRAVRIARLAVRPAPGRAAHRAARPGRRLSPLPRGPFMTLTLLWKLLRDLRFTLAAVCLLLGAF